MTDSDTDDYRDWLRLAEEAFGVPADSRYVVADVDH